MTQIWPNPRAAEANRTTDTNSVVAGPKDTTRGYLVHAQFMIGAGVLQLAMVVLSSGLNAVVRSDYDKFENAFDLAMLALSATTLFMLAIFCLAGWIVTTSGYSDLNSRVQQDTTPFLKNDSGQQIHRLLFLLSLGVLLVGLFVLGWLRSEKLIPSGLNAAGMALISVLMSICCFVYAVVQIRKALKLISQGTYD